MRLLSVQSFDFGSLKAEDLFNFGQHVNIQNLFKIFENITVLWVYEITYLFKSCHCNKETFTAIKKLLQTKFPNNQTQFRISFRSKTILKY